MKTGDRIGGYELLEKLGEGGMAEVWKARNIALERVVAIKFLLEQFGSDPDLQQRFLQEGRIQARLQHPQIVGVLHAGSENGRAFLVTDFVEGKSLEELLRAHGGMPLPVEEVLSISYDVLSALEYAHNLPQGAIVHRDVKPSNILLDGKGRARLADFGIAVALNENRKTKTGFALGSVFYMSPEQIQTPRAIDWRSDIYSFGCVLYEMLTGRPPFGEDTDSDFTIKQAHVQTPPEPMRKWNPQVPFEFEWIVFRALSKDRERRFASAAEMADAVRPIVPGPRRDKRAPTVVEQAPERQMSESRTVGLGAAEDDKGKSSKRSEPVHPETRMEPAIREPRPAWMRWFWPKFETRKSARQAINIAALIYLAAGLIALGFSFFGSLGRSKGDNVILLAVVCFLFSACIWRGWRVAIIIAMLPLLHPFFWILIPFSIRALRAANLVAGLPEGENDDLAPTSPPLMPEGPRVQHGSRFEQARGKVGRPKTGFDSRPGLHQWLWPRFEEVQSASRAINMAALTILVSSFALLGWGFSRNISNQERWIIQWTSLVLGVLALGIWRRLKIAIVATIIPAVLAFAGFCFSFLSELSYASDALKLLVGSLLCPVLLIVIGVSISAWFELQWVREAWALPVTCGVASLLLLGTIYVGIRAEVALALSGLYCLLALGAWRRWKMVDYVILASSVLTVIYFYSIFGGVYLTYARISSAATAIALAIIPALTRALSAARVYPLLSRGIGKIGQTEVN